jgi:hypothetical protein
MVYTRSMDELLKVVTLSEAAQLWYLHPDTVRRAIFTRRNPLVARKSPNGWLITYQSCVRRWGHPPREIRLAF